MSQKRARSTTSETAVMTFVCDFDSCTFEANSSSSLKRHKVSHSAPLLHCDFTGCPYETKDSSHLKRHKLNHTSVFKCDFNGCDFETNTALKLKHHSLTHSNEAVIFKCDVCEYTSDLKHNLTRHKKEAHGQLAKGGKLLSHFNETFKCDFSGCDFETNTALKLKRHSLTHSNETFKCESNGCDF